MGMNSKEFREELVKIMPGYVWTVNKSFSKKLLKATGTMSSGSNRLSTLSVTRTEQENGSVSYEAKSSGYGIRAAWLHAHTDGTLARALRGLQSHYEASFYVYRSHADALKEGRKVALPPIRNGGMDSGLADVKGPNHAA